MRFAMTGATDNILRQQFAQIIFERLAAQISGLRTKEYYWDAAYQGWVDNPALFPLIEACIDAADQCLNALETSSKSPLM